jgi:integrase
MPKYLYRRPNSPNWWFELTLPADVRDKLNGGKKRIRRSTETDSEKQASFKATRWAEELWLQIDKARSPDWAYHGMKAGVEKQKADGLSDDEIEDLAFMNHIDDEVAWDAYERATGKVVVLRDHLEGYLAWCEKEQNNLPKTIKAKRSMITQFCDRFVRLDRVTEQAVMRWTSERDVKGATQKAMKTFSRDFYTYLGNKVLSKKLDTSVLDNFQTKTINSTPKEVISGEVFRKELAATKKKDGLMLLAYTGRRSVALANLRCNDVVMADGVKCFRIRIDKGLRPETDKPHYIPIHSKLSDIVDRLLRDSKDGYLLPLSGKTTETRSEALQTQVKRGRKTTDPDYITAHQFRTSVITMLHNSPEELADKTIYSVVGHKDKLSDDAHKRHYLKGIMPSRLLVTTEEINWDDWVYPLQEEYVYEVEQL